MGLCSHSHPRSKGYDHTDERWCCSLDGLAQSHICLSSMNHHLAPVSLCPWVTFYLKREKKQKKQTPGIRFCVSGCLPYLNHSSNPLSHFCLFKILLPQMSLFLRVSLFSFPLLDPHIQPPPTHPHNLIYCHIQANRHHTEFCPGEGLAVLGLGKVKEYRTLILL